MHARLRFTLTEVLELADHAMAAPAHTDPVDDEPAGPALLLVADDGVYLLSNGHPQVPPASGQPATSGVRAVFADGLRAGTDWLDQVHALGGADDLPVALPLQEPTARPLIDQLPAGVGLGHDTLTLSITGDQLILVTSGPTTRSRKGPRAARS